jgi:hypothetical protein
MFDNQNFNPGLQPPKVDDIFGQTDPTASKVARPTGPGPAPNLPPAVRAPIYDEEIFGGRSLMSNKVLILEIVALVVVGAAIAGGLFWFFSRPKADQPAALTTDTAGQNQIATQPPVDLAAPTSTQPQQPTAAVEPPQDTDGDGLSDDMERELGTDPNKVDTDEDGLMDKAEAMLFKSDPLNPDTDGDGYRDGEEVINGYDPTKPGKARLFNVP